MEHVDRVLLNQYMSQEPKVTGVTKILEVDYPSF